MRSVRPDAEPLKPVDAEGAVGPLGVFEFFTHADPWKPAPRAGPAAPDPLVQVVLARVAPPGPDPADCAQPNGLPARAGGAGQCGRDIRPGRLATGEFPLTAGGATVVVGLLHALGYEASAAAAADRRVEQAGCGERPVWDDRARELWWRLRLVKRFRNDAANQRLILQAFEEQGWPTRIADPLPHAAGLNRKVRLRETVRGLHRGQRQLLLRFHADGAGTGVRWEFVE